MKKPTAGDRPPALPIATAPAPSGAEWGPCLLFPGPPRFEAQWTIGRWTGRQWCDDSSELCYPTHWAPLPAAS